LQQSSFRKKTNLIWHRESKGFSKIISPGHFQRIESIHIPPNQYRQPILSVRRSIVEDPHLSSA
jgi:hypothetical protein